MRLLPLATALVAAPVFAQAPPVPPARDFAAAAANADAFETMAATAALAQSRDADVRRFATTMIADHARTADALAQAATAAGIEPPPRQIGADQAGFLGALGAVTGPEFDKLYWKQQALAHRAALVTEQGYAASGDFAPLRAAAAAAVPVIQAHLAMAERMAAKGE